MSNSFQCWLYHKVYNGLSVLSPFVGIFWRKLTEVYLRERRHCLTKVKCFLTSLILKLWWRWWGWWWWCWWSPSWWWRWWGSGWEWCWWWWWWSPSTNFMHKQWIFCIKIQNMPRTSPNDFSFRLVEATLLLLLSWVQLVGLREAWQDLARSWEDLQRLGSGWWEDMWPKVTNFLGELWERRGAEKWSSSQSKLS